MKKLLISACAVAFAAVTQAASINWTTGDLYGSNDNYISDNAALGYTYTALVTILGIGDSTGTQSYDEFSGSYAWGTYAPSTEYAATILITEYKDGNAYMQMTGAGSFITQASESFNTAINFGSGLGFTPATGKLGEWEAVPEPFSGTLALLGMGVVALRRKMKKAKKA